jgi:hypothetical protein
MPTSFLGLFLVSTALSLVATFTAVCVQALVRKLRPSTQDEPRRLR